MSPNDERRIIETQLNYLTEKISELEAQMPSPEEKAFLQNEKLARERANWAWKKVRESWPYITGAGAFGFGVYQFVEWFSRHFRWTGGPSGP